jgi:hypothetical protein
MCTTPGSRLDKERDFLLGEAAPRGKETTVERPLAGMVDRGEDGGPVVRPERADVDAGAVANASTAT